MNSLKSSVVSTLSDSTTAKIKSFSYGNCKITSSLYQLLSTYIRYNDNPTIVKGKNTCYKPSQNELVFTFSKAVSIPNKALVIHESTHAIMDMLKVKTTVKYAEMFAYIAQSQYIYVSKPGNGPLEASSYQMQAVFEKSWNIAKKIQMGSSIDSEDYENLADTILKAPKYESQCDVLADYNGI